jgi:hypothetical protein
MKNSVFLFLLTGFVVLSGRTPAMGSDFSLIVAPARYNVLQVMFDIVNRNPAVLVSYQGEAATENPALHVWDGASWNAIGMHELQELGFLQRTPSRAILVGEDDLLPRTIRDSLAWLPEVAYVRELSHAPMLNEFGRILDWSSREWRWMARRYNLDLEDEAEPVRKSSWYDQRGPKPKHASEQGSVPAPVNVPPPQQEYYPPAERVTVDLSSPVVAPAPVELEPLREAAPEIVTETIVTPTPVVPPAAVTEAKPANLDEFIKTLEAERAKSSDESFPIK